MKLKKLLLSIIVRSITINFSYSEPLSIEKQGSFTVGGSFIEYGGEFSAENFVNPEGQRAYGDFAYVKFQIPEKAKTLPLVFQHGGAQSSRTWESTLDGREGFDTLFLRKGYKVYLLDQPRSGKSNFSTKQITPETPWVSNPMFGDKTLYILSRIGHFENNKAIPNQQFPQDDEIYEKFQQSWTLGSGPLDNDLNAKVLAKLVDDLGGAVLFTHSMGGTIGWRAAMLSEKVKAIVAFEPGGTEFIFPENQMPEIKKAKFAPLSASAKAVSVEEFKKLTQIPIILYYGDYINLGSANVGEDKWGSEMDTARQFVDTINKNGGKAELVHLPSIGIKGNSHFLMGELNNREIADLVANWLEKQGF